MSEKKYSDDELYDAYLNGGSTRRGAIRFLDVSFSGSLSDRIKKIVEKRQSLSYFIPPEVPNITRDPKTIIALAAQHQKRVQAHFYAKQHCVIPITVEGPFGVAVIPDQHLDNPGTDIALAFQHVELIAKTEGLYAIEVGDSIDNFLVGKHAEARADHVITQTEAWRMTEYYHQIIGPKLLAALSGNHLDWTKQFGGVNHFQELLRLNGIHALYDADELFFSIQSPNGRKWKYGMRHFFQGGSLWNSAHSIARYAMSHAYRNEDVIVAGHKHVAGYNLLETRGQIVHCVQVGSYKNRDFDDYCRTKGFMAQHPFMCPVMIHDPDTGETDFFKSVERAIPILQSLRSRK
mgnify:CR=1 FL=1